MCDMRPGRKSVASSIGDCLDAFTYSGNDLYCRHCQKNISGTEKIQTDQHVERSLNIAGMHKKDSQ